MFFRDPERTERAVTCMLVDRSGRFGSGIALLSEMDQAIVGIEGVMLEIKGTNGILRIDLSKEELREMP